MYWPTGVPKAYALSKHAIKAGKEEQSEDGLDKSAAPNPPVQPGHGENENGDVKEHDGSDRSVTDVNGTTNPANESEILGAKVSRGGQTFATITMTAVTVWQTRPVVALAAVVRSPKSMRAYGQNSALLLRPDGMLVIVQTEMGYLITYSLTFESQALVYRTQLSESSRAARRSSTADGYTSYLTSSDSYSNNPSGPNSGIREATLRFRMVIRIDAGISKSIALDDELLVATKKPAALQCIRWASEEGLPQTATELLARLDWYTSEGSLVEMVHDRPMNLLCWIDNVGNAYAVQRRKERRGEARAAFQGFCFRQPMNEGDYAIKTAINARFSLIAIACKSGRIDVYVVKDYSGNVPVSHEHVLPNPSATTGNLTLLAYSPDGYCLFAGYETGWAMWSVYGKALASSFGGDSAMARSNGETWLSGTKDAFWFGGGCELAIVAPHDDRVWLLDVARNAAAGCLTPANISRGLLHSSSSITLYKGHDVPDLTALASDLGLWQTFQMPRSYVAAQWPIKTVVISPDSKYIAIAGRKGLAHYSVASGRWKVFDDPTVEDQFAVRGGMCWFQHFLVAAQETENDYRLRAYSREKSLGRPLCEKELTAPAICITLSGTDSLLVYTYDNVLLHYIIAPYGNSMKLIQVGQIGFHGIIRAPPRVRTISWILPEAQMESGDPSQDVATATILFLVDGKVVLLQPSSNDQGELKYDMRVIAQNVEYYILMRDQPGALSDPASDGAVGTPNDEFSSPLGHSLRDSLWYFDGECYHVWSDVQDVLACAPNELGRDLPPTVRVPMDFYPISAMAAKGIIYGLDSELVQRRDVNFSMFRNTSRTQLFLPRLLRHHLAEYNSPAALHLASSYVHLPYFAHALEILLHDVLDTEVDTPPSPPETALLPTVVSFLSSFPAYLDIVVNCTRKTELRSWHTLFACLPPVQQLFELSLEQAKLKTAAGYLLVLHAFEQDQDSFQELEFSRLLGRAVAEQDWDLCGELARFLMGIDGSGQTLRSVLAKAGLQDAPNGASVQNGTRSPGSINELLSPQGPERSSEAGRHEVDYFSFGQGG